jgi:hypothetical protein
MSIIYPYRSSSALGCVVGRRQRRGKETPCLSVSRTRCLAVRAPSPKAPSVDGRHSCVSQCVLRALYLGGRRYHCAVRTQHLDTYIYREKYNCTCRNSEKLVIFTSSLIKSAKSFQNAVGEMFYCGWWAV